MNMISLTSTAVKAVALPLYALCLCLCLCCGNAVAEEAVDAGMPRFDILEYAVEGNSKLTDLDIERAVMPFLGERKTLRDVEGARSALEGAYHNAGYLTVVVSIPEQDVGGGMVTLSVLEGEVERVRVKGAEYHLSSGIRSRVPELAEGNVPYFPEVQRQLDALNRGADLKVTPVLKAGRTPGKVAIQMDVEDELPVHGSIDFSNRQSPNTTAERLSATLRYDNLWQLGHSASVSMQTSPQKTDEVRTLAGTYVLPRGDRGDAIVMYAVASRSKFATIAGSPGLGVLGDSNIVGLRYAIPLPAHNSFSHSLSLGFDYKDVKQTVVVAGSNELPVPITYAPLVAAYSGGWTGAGGSTLLDLTATHGIRGLFGNSDDEFGKKKAGALANFFTLRGGVQHTELIDRWALSGKVEAQVASGPLVSNEQFTAGGAESVRGYLESERVGDGALRFAMELRTPRLPLAGKSSPRHVSGLAFYEGARLRTLQPTFPQPSYQIIRGIGVGLRAGAEHGLSFDLDLAKALDNGDITRAGEIRVHSRLQMEF